MTLTSAVTGKNAVEDGVWILDNMTAKQAATWGWLRSVQSGEIRWVRDARVDVYASWGDAYDSLRKVIETIIDQCFDTQIALSDRETITKLSVRQACAEVTTRYGCATWVQLGPAPDGNLEKIVVMNTLEITGTCT